MAQQDFSMFDKVGTFAEGVAKRVAKPTTPLAQNLLINPPEKEPTDPRKRDFPTFFPVGIPGVGGVMIEDDQVKPLTDKPYLTTEPALGTDVEIKYGEPFLGFKPIESRMRKVVQREKLTPILAVRGVKQDGSFFTPYDAPNYADVGESQIMNADFMVNKEGQREKLLSSDTFEDRITAINNFKATQLTYERPSGEQIENINFSKIIDDATQYTDQMRDNVAKIPLVSEDDALHTMLNFGTDEATNRAIYANKLVQRLKKMGITDERTIAGIVAYQSQLPELGGVGYGDFSKVIGASRVGTRFIFEPFGYLLGETFDVLTDEVTDDTQGFDLRKSEDRGAFYDRAFPSQAAAIQDRYLQLGIDISYPEAERLARDFSGIGMTTAGIAAEVKPTTGFFTSLKQLGGEREIKLFKQYAQRQRKIFGDNISDDEILVNFKRHRQQQLPFIDNFGANVNVGPITEKLYDVRLLGIGTLAQAVGNKIAYINGVRSSSALRAGMNLEEAALSVTSRIDVRNMIKYRRDLVKQRTAIYNKADGEGRVISSAEYDAIQSINRKLQVTKKDLRRIVAEGDAPRFVVEAVKMDRNMIIGAAAGNQVVATFTDADPMLGEFFGGMTAIGYTIFRDVNEGGALLKKFTFGKDKKEINSAELILRNMSDFSPEFQAAMRVRIAYFNDLKQQLIQIGVPERVLETSSLRIMGLSVLQAIEEGHRLELNAPSAAYFNDTLQNLQENANIQSLYAAELRAAYSQLAEQQGIDMENPAVKKFYTYVQRSIELAEGNVRQLEADIAVINRDYASSIEGYIRGAGDGMAHTLPATATSLDQAFERVANFNISRADKTNIESIKQAANDTNEFMLNAVEKKANEVKRRLPNQQQVNRQVDEVLPNGKIIKPGKEPVKTDAIETPGDALAVTLESVHVEQKKIASAPYIVLDNSQFYYRDASGAKQVVYGVPTTDAGPILDKMFDIMGTKDGLDLIVALQQSSLRPSEATKMYAVLDDFAGGFLADAVEKLPDVDNVQTLVDGAIEAAKESSDPILRKLATDPRLKNNKNLIAMYSIRADLAAQEIDIDALPMSFLQAKELNSAIGNLASKATNDTARLNIKELESISTATLDNFSITNKDGQSVPVGRLMIDDGSGGDVSVPDYLAAANAGWTEYKNRFFDDKTIRKWMGWNDKNARVPKTPSSQNPLGFTHGDNPPSGWLNLESVGTKSINNVELNKTFASTFGEKGEDGVYRIMYDSPKGKAVRASLEAHFREWLINTIESGKPIDYNELLLKAKNIEETFVAHRSAPDVEGSTEVALIDARKVIQDVFPDFSSTTLSKKDYEAAGQALERAVKKESQRVVDEATNVKKIYADSARFLKRYSADDLDSSNVANVILEGGVERLNSLKSHLMLNGASEADISLALKGILVQEIESKAFKLTSLMTPDPENPQRLLPDSELNVAAIKDILGLNNATRQAAVKSIIGEEYYDKYMKLVEFIEANSLEKMKGINMVGIPRPFSIESYISRFYAINRNVVSFRYVATEAVLQSYRQKNMRLITAALTDPKVGNALLEIIATGKPLSADKDKQLFNALVLGAERIDNVFETKQESEISDENGNKIGVQFSIPSFP